MAILRITYKHSKLMPSLPHKIIIDGHLWGIMKTDHIELQLPASAFTLTIQSFIPFLSASTEVTLSHNQEKNITFHDREKAWDILFTIDILLSIAKLFFTLNSPWNTIYEIATNGYFAVWLIYEWRIRNHYFDITEQQTAGK